MIEHIRGNWLLLSLMMIYGLFALVGEITPKPYLAFAVGIMAFLSGAFMFVNYAPKAWDILWRKERGKYGAHNAILGGAEFSLGLVVSGGGRLLWYYFDRPEAWSGSWPLSLGLFMVAKGSFRMAISPTDETLSPRFPEGFWAFVLWVSGLVVAFIAGTHFQ